MAIFSLSPSKISTYQDCPRKYRFLYVDRLGPWFRKARPFLTLGSNVHAALKDFFAVPPPRRRPEMLEPLLETLWARNRKGFSSADQEEDYKTRALEQLRQFASTFNLNAAPLMLEQKIHRKVSGVTLRGIVDRMDREGDSAHLMDYKTGKSQHDLGPFSLYFYSLILQRFKGLPPVERLSFVYLQDGSTRTWDYDHFAAMQTMSSVLETAYTISEDREFNPAPTRMCRLCDFLSICRQGREASLGRAQRTVAAPEAPHGDERKPPDLVVPTRRNLARPIPLSG